MAVPKGGSNGGGGPQKNLQNIALFFGRYITSKTANFFYLLDNRVYNSEMRLFKSSKQTDFRQSVKTKPQFDKLATLFKSLRILRSEFLMLRQELSVLKRDVSRIDRKVYRDEEPLSLNDQIELMRRKR